MIGYVAAGIMTVVINSAPVKALLALANVGRYKIGKARQSYLTRFAWFLHGLHSVCAIYVSFLLSFFLNVLINLDYRTIFHHDLH